MFQLSGLTLALRLGTIFHALYVPFRFWGHGGAI